MGLNKLERYSHGGYLIKVVVAGEVLKSSPLFCHGLITIMIASGEGKGTRSADSGRCWHGQLGISLTFPPANQ